MNHTSCILPWEKKEQACQANYWVIYFFAILGGNLYLHKSHVRIRSVTVPSGDIFVYIKISAFPVHREQTSVLHPSCVWYPQLTRIVRCLFICWDEALCFICVAGCTGWDSASGWNGRVGIWQGVHHVPGFLMVGCIALTTSQQGELKRTGECQMPGVEGWQREVASGVNCQ